MVDPAPRTVTLTAASLVRRGRPIPLTGTLAYSVYLASQVPQPIEIFARRIGSTRFVRIATVTPTSVNSDDLRWQFLVRPRTTTTYVALASWQPVGGVRWQVARSAPATVVVRN